MNYWAFLIVALALVAYMTIWFGIGFRLKRLDVADTAWGGGFIVAAATSLAVHSSPRLLLMSALVLIWGLRLASHIWRRNSFKGPDPRYDELTKKWSKRGFWLKAYPQIFLVQGFLIYLVALPITVVGAAPAAKLFVLILIPVAIWVFGFTFEAVADKQLKAFIVSKKGGVMDSGLWRYSRHPNYFGEVTQWWALALVALPVSFGWLGLFGGATITLLILFVSGIPLIEKRYAGNPEYKKYQQLTSAFVPLPRRSI